MGEKARMQLQRDMRDKIKMTVADVGKVKVTFSQVCAFNVPKISATTFVKCSA